MNEPSEWPYRFLRLFLYTILVIALWSIAWSVWGPLMEPEPETVELSGVEVQPPPGPLDHDASREWAVDRYTVLLHHFQDTVAVLDSLRQMKCVKAWRG